MSLTAWSCAWNIEMPPIRCDFFVGINLSLTVAVRSTVVDRITPSMCHFSHKALTPLSVSLRTWPSCGCHFLSSCSTDGARHGASCGAVVTTAFWSQGTEAGLWSPWMGWHWRSATLQHILFTQTYTVFPCLWISWVVMIACLCTH